MKKWLIIVVAVVVVGCCVAGFLLGDIFNGDTNDDEPTNAQSTTSEVPEYAVTFYSDDGTILKIDYVKQNEAAVPPVSPVMTYGMIFKSWDTDFSNVTKNLEVRPVCDSVRGKTNVVALQSAYSKKDNTAFVPIQLCGDVCVAGLDLIIKYDSNLLRLESITEDKSVLYNIATPGVIRLNYISSENTDADVDIGILRFSVIAEEGEVPVTVEINDIYAFEGQSDDLIVPQSSVIDAKVFIVK